MGVRATVATGGVWSILMVTGTDAVSPTPFVAEQVRVTPAVSVVNVVEVHPEDDAIPDSGSVTFQETVTVLRYHPLFPKVPAIAGVMTGGVVSICWKIAKGDREVTVPQMIKFVVSTEVVTFTHTVPLK